MRKQHTTMNEKQPPGKLRVQRRQPMYGTVGQGFRFGLDRKGTMSLFPLVLLVIEQKRSVYAGKQYSRRTVDYRRENEIRRFRHITLFCPYFALFCPVL